MSKPEKQELVFVPPERLAALWHTTLEGAVVLCGSGCRVPQEVVEEWESNPGSIDKSFAHCSMVTSIPVQTLHTWRKSGHLRVRAIGPGKTDKLLVAPAELERVMRQFAALRNGTVEVPETPAQARARGEKDRLAALEACGG